MAFTQAQLDALDTALAQGALSVEYGGKRVTYRSLEEMLALREQMQRELAPTATAAQRRTVVTFQR